ncbi:hypothetical protein DL93DRAFT_2231772 [Clavulina sp. PMI_390]|nr:hypothetical protein DL93DRAFT_2231772 [Clavulina sp. PMI_390]
MERQTLCTIGQDLLLELFRFFDDPRDLLCLRLVSNYFNAMTRKPVVWRRILQAQCSQYHIPHCTYMTSRTTSADELERAVTRPYRFVSKLASSDPACILERIVRLRTSPVSSTIEHLKSLVSLPRGRFVISISSISNIGIWDFGHPSDSSPHPKPRLLLCLQPPADVAGLKGCTVRALPTISDDEWRIVAIFEATARTDYSIYSCLVRLSLLLGDLCTDESHSAWQPMGTSADVPEHSADGRWLVRFSPPYIHLHDLLRQKTGIICPMQGEPYSVVYIHVGPCEAKDSDLVDTTVVINTGRPVRAQIYQYRVALNDSTPALPSDIRTTEPLDIKILSFCVDSSIYPNIMGPLYGTEPPVILFGGISPRVFRMGYTQPPGPTNEFPALMPAEHLSEEVTFEIGDICRVGDKLAVFGTEAENRQEVLCKVVRETWESPASAGKPGRAIAVLPAGALIHRDWYESAWRGSCYAIGNQDQHCGEVRIYDYVD